MERVKTALENLDEKFYEIEDRLNNYKNGLRDESKKAAEMIKVSRSHEANTMALAQKVAARLDQTIEHVESILRH